MSDLEDRLEELTTATPTAHVTVGDAWARGRTRRRRTRVVSGAAALSLLLVVAVAAAMFRSNDGSDAVETITGPDQTTDTTAAPDVGDAERPQGDTTPVNTGAFGFETLTTSFQSGSFPFVRFATDLASFDKVASELAIRGGESPITQADFESHYDPSSRAIVVFTVPTSGCPPVFAGLDTVESGVLAPLFINPGHINCTRPLLSFTVVAAVDRGTFDGIATLRLPAQEPYFSAAVETPVALGEGFPGITDDFISTEFGTEIGSAPLPPKGEAALAADTFNVPFVIVHHPDGTVSAIDARIPNRTGRTRGLVRWDADRRTFFAGNSDLGVFDEYGRRIDGPRSTDLTTHATQVDGDMVRFGDIVRTPIGDPIVKNPGPSADIDLDVSALILMTLDQGLNAPIGTVVHVDATMVADASGARVCKLDPETVTRTFSVTCPSDAPKAFDVDLVGDITLLPAPLLATRVDGGFADIVTFGDPRVQFAD